MISGFLLTRQWREREDEQDLIFWLATTDGPLKLVIESEQSVCFVAADKVDSMRAIIADQVAWRSSEVALKNFDEQPVHACYFKSQKGLNIARARLGRAGIALSEADIRPTDRYLMERFITGGVDVQCEIAISGGQRVGMNPKLRPSEFKAQLKVVSVDIETSVTRNTLLSIAVHANDDSKVFMLGPIVQGCPDYLVFVDDEIALINAFITWIQVADVDVIIGWSIVAFDLTFLQQRCDALGIRFCIGRGGELAEWRTAQQGADRKYVLVPGRVVLDGIELLRTATFSFESFSLESVARQLLGRGKLIDDVDARASEIEQMFMRDKAKLAEYNLEDCVLVSEIFAATGLLDFAEERSRLTGLEMDRAGGSVAAFDFLYLPRLHRAGYVGPVLTNSVVQGSPGGYVLDSKPGLYNFVVLLDFKSLYPSLIRTFHVDPLAMVVARNEEDGIPGFLGAKFSRHHYILPDIIERLWTARDEAKRSGRSAMSTAIKIIMNSFYGVLGTTGCRFFDPRLVSSITLRGHEILKRTRDLIEAKGLSVIYGDTDSVFVLIDRANEVNEAERIGRELTDYLNTWWHDYLQEELRVRSCLEVEYETCFSRFLMPTVRGSEVGSKKRYAGLTAGDKPKLVFKGLETVRSDWSPLAREFQQVLYEKIFRDAPFEDFVRDTVTSVCRGERDDKLVLRRRLRRKLAEYEKNVPPHVRAARIAEEIRAARGLPLQHRRGAWVEYVMTVNGPEPKAYRASAIDYEFYVDRQLAPIADAILSFKSTSLKKITDRQLGLF